MTMSNTDQNRKSASTIRCRIVDLKEGIYSKDEKGINTIYGLIKRTKIVGTVIFKKIQSNPNQEEEMIKSSQGSSKRLSFQIDDGTSIIWVNFWNVSEKLDQRIMRGDLVQVVGRVSTYNDIVQINGEIVNKIDNPNEEMLHELEMIKFLKKNGKRDLSLIKNVEKESIFIEEIEEESFEKPSNSKKTEFKEEKYNSEEFGEFDDFTDDIDEDELEEKLVKVIKSHDKGDGVELNILIGIIGGNVDLIEDILKKMALNSKIFKISKNIYKLN